MEFRKCEGTLRELFSEIDQRGRAGCGESRQSGSVGGMRRRTIRQRALSLPNLGTPISVPGGWPTVSVPFSRQRERCRTDARMIRRETVQSEQFVANTG